MEDEFDDGEVIDGLKSGLTFQDFADEYGFSAAETQKYVSELRDEGYDIEQRGDVFTTGSEQDNQYSWVNEDGDYKFAVISDTHLGSEAEQLDSLNNFYDRLEDEDVDVVFHAGDISDGSVSNNGRGIYRGQVNHLKPEATTWGRLMDYVEENYPEREGIDTLFISGNHDHQLFKERGIRLGEEVADGRDDLHWLGDSYANVDLGEIDMDLVHPSGGTPYTLGYRAQTWLRDKPEEEKADITVFGHLHQFLNAETEGSQVLYAGAWQGSTPFLERKGIKPKAGGWILDMEVEDEEIRSFSTDRVMYPLDDGTDVSADEVQEILDE